MSLLSFSQNLGGAVFVAISNAIFSNSLRSELLQHASDISTNAVLQAGTTAFRDLVSGDNLPGVLLAYANSVNHTFYLTTGLAFVGLCSVCRLGWVDMKAEEAGIAWV